MHILRKISFTHIILLISALILASALTVYLKIKQAERQYQFFRLSESKVDPLFDELNYLVYQNLLIPKNVQEINLKDRGSLEHGRTLVIEYSFSGRKIEDIFIDYDQFLTVNEWKLINNSDDRSIEYSYNKGTACLDIYSFKSTNEYQLYIYHDFFKQGFSPTLSPPLNKKIVLLMEFGETHFVECPKAKQ